jgi:hypothetical protein
MSERLARIPRIPGQQNLNRLAALGTLSRGAQGCPGN